MEPKKIVFKNGSEIDLSNVDESVRGNCPIPVSLNQPYLDFITKTTINDIIESFSKNENEKVKELLIQKLRFLDFNFKDESEFYDFCSRRVRKVVSFGLYDYTLYLDYDDISKSGIKLVSCATEITETPEFNIKAIVSIE